MWSYSCAPCRSLRSNRPWSREPSRITASNHGARRPHAPANSAKDTRRNFCFWKLTISTDLMAASTGHVPKSEVRATLGWRDTADRGIGSRRRKPSRSCKVGKGMKKKQKRHEVASHSGPCHHTHRPDAEARSPSDIGVASCRRSQHQIRLSRNDILTKRKKIQKIVVFWFICSIPFRGEM